MEISHANSIQLLLTDLVMPGGMNGKELADQLAIAQPGLKVLLMSGYTDSSLEYLGMDKNNFLSKPFTPSALASRVREVLDRPPGG